ncbi:MAG: hypothetical protein GY895_18140 [Phycisphaera sp.]|nr:hypothetical protein [Phycisphaera sp.]
MEDHPDPAPHPDAEGGRIVAELPCRECRYTLIGCSIGDRCPECGLPVEASLHASIDLETIDGSALPNPRSVSAAVGTLAIAALTWALGSMILWWSNTTATFGFTNPLPRDTPWIVGMIGAVLVVAAVMLTIRARRSWPGMTSNMARWALLYSGIVVILVTSLGPFASDWVVPFIRSAGMIGIIVGLCDVLDRAGRRALAYRQAGTAIQSRTPLLLAVGVEMAAGLIGDFEIARILGLTASTLVLIGTVYLVANAFWATLPLLREKHRYRDLVSSPMRPNRD